MYCLFCPRSCVLPGLVFKSLTHFDFCVWCEIVGFILGMQEWFNIHKSIKMIHHINKMRGKNHMIIWIDTEKHLRRQHPFMTKTLNKMCIKEMFHIYALVYCIGLYLSGLLQKPLQYFNVISFQLIKINEKKKKFTVSSKKKKRYGGKANFFFYFYLLLFFAALIPKP